MLKPVCLKGLMYMRKTLKSALESGTNIGLYNAIWHYFCIHSADLNFQKFPKCKPFCVVWHGVKLASLSGVVFCSLGPVSEKFDRTAG
jgi:hypothetical protein